MVKSAAKTAPNATRKAAPIAAPKTRAGESARAASGGDIPVRVRMYRHGLGDCFLITFGVGGQETHMMIDCGTLGAKTTGNKLGDIVQHIFDTTGGHLHLLVATHEHQDHLSGFNTQRALFDKFTVDHVWLAWTENPTDPFAQRIKKYANDLGASLAVTAAALQRLGKNDPETAELGLAIESLLGFAGAGAPEAELLGAGNFAETVNKAMEYVRTRASQVRHLDPGELVEVPWIAGFRFYVLGPPKNESALNEVGDHETEALYHLAAGLGAAAQSVGPAGDEEPDPRAELEMPFEQHFRLAPDDRLAAPARKLYDDPAQDWRRIEADWLGAGGALALQLDSITNNTSLALAIERVSDGKVLLFPADAQLGHWESWHDKNLVWQAGSRSVRAPDLLHQTVFYKVGHHSSHNATARALGLEMMARENDLVAFIPVDRQVALGRNPKGSWAMPATGLYRRLLEKCQGRVVRSDTGWAADVSEAALPDVEAEFKDLAPAKAWADYQKAQAAVDKKTVVVEKLYVDFFLR